MFRKMRKEWIKVRLLGENLDGKELRQIFANRSNNVVKFKEVLWMESEKTKFSKN